MLTKGDFQQLKKIIRDEVEAEGKNTRSELNSEIVSSRMRVQEDIRELSDRTKNLEIRVNNVEKSTKKIQKTLDKTIDFFDHEVLGLKKRVQLIEDNPNLKLQQF